MVFYNIETEKDKYIINDHTNIIESIDICGKEQIEAITTSDWYKAGFPEEEDDESIDINKFIQGEDFTKLSNQKSNDENDNLNIF